MFDGPNSEQATGGLWLMQREQLSCVQLNNYKTINLRMVDRSTRSLSGITFCFVEESLGRRFITPVLICLSQIRQ